MLQYVLMLLNKLTIVNSYIPLFTVFILGFLFGENQEFWGESVVIANYTCDSWNSYKTSYLAKNVSQVLILIMEIAIVVITTWEFLIVQSVYH